MRIPFLLKKLLKNEKIVLTSKQVYSIVSLVFERTQYARVAQLVERDLAKVEAAGSSPVSRFSYAQMCRASQRGELYIGFMQGHGLCKASFVLCCTWKRHKKAMNR